MSISVTESRETPVGVGLQRVTAKKYLLQNPCNALRQRGLECNSKKTCCYKLLSEKNWVKYGGKLAQVVDIKKNMLCNLSEKTRWRVNLKLTKTGC